MFFLLLACVPHDSATDTAVTDPCDCERPDVRTFAPTAQGGFDDWSGTALGWAVDDDHDRVLVVGLRFLLPASQVVFAPECADPDAIWDSWFVDVPPSCQQAVQDWPLLATGLMTAAGIHGLPAESAAVLIEGDPTQATPDRIWVATDGDGTLLRGEGYDAFQGAFTFVASTTGDGDVVATCDEGFRLGGIDLSWVSDGED